MKLIDLSHPIAADMDQYPGDSRPVVVERWQEHDRDGHQSSGLSMGCHVSTHLDTPLHFLAGQPALESLPLTAFSGRARVVRVDAVDPPRPLEAAGVDVGAVDGIDFLLLRTGWERHWGTPRYYETWPTIGVELATRLARGGLKGVGLDSPSPDRLGEHVVHDLFAAAGMINIENLANLAELPSGVFTFLALPLKLVGVEASPVRAVALV